jgi:hypothetical protein
MNNYAAQPGPQTLDNHPVVYNNSVVQSLTQQGARIMAKTNGVNKSKAIRGYYKLHKKAKPLEVVEALAKQGIETTANYVSNLKAKHNKRGRVVKKAFAKGGIGVPEIKAALAFIKLTGSIKAANQALTVAREIRAIV